MIRYTGKSFISDVLNGMYDWVRVIDKNSNIVYMNKAMCDGLGGNKSGQKCYLATGKNEPCMNCISRKSIFDGNTHEKEEYIQGRVYSVMSSPLRDESGEIIGAVEVLRDVTTVRQLQQKVKSQNQRLQNDLARAIKLQRSLLPSDFYDDRAEFSYFYKPCETLGGDFIDIFKIDKDNIGIYIADVSGHGITSSMLTIFLHSTLDKSQKSPSQALTQLYEKYNNSGIFQDLYITIFYAVVNVSEYTITYSNAGHNVVPVVFNNGSLELLKSAGVPISNWLPEPCYYDTVKFLKAGDNIFFYTDGIVEIRDSNNEQFGEERLVDALTTASGSPEEILKRLLKRVADFMGEAGISSANDDITAALLQIK